VRIPLKPQVRQIECPPKCTRETPQFQGGCPRRSGRVVLETSAGSHDPEHNPYCAPPNPPIARHHAPSPCRPVPDFPSCRPIYYRVSRAPDRMAVHGAGIESPGIRCKRGRFCSRQNGSGSLVRSQGWNGSSGAHASGAGHGYRAADHSGPPRLPSAATLPVNGRRHRGVSWVRCGSRRGIGLRRC
jgi:hypothetical protein